ncbi:MAG: hypothetical protein QOE33_2285 [Acidobacteriota bacterium]|nr:hypothetical protein [Acidobacteriota bacterium]
MEQLRKRVYMPPRNVISSLLPLTVVTWYFTDKLGGGRTFLKFVLVIAAAIAQGAVVYISSRTRKKRRSFFWSIYNFLTGNGRLPMRLLANALALVVFWGTCFEFSGLQRQGGNPQSFIIRFMEVDLFWSILNFLGISDDSIKTYGFSKFLTILTAISGLMFWGMYISILVNKFMELQSLSTKNASPREIDLINYNEGVNTSDEEVDS